VERVGGATIGALKRPQRVGRWSNDWGAEAPASTMPLPQTFSSPRPWCCRPLWLALSSPGASPATPISPSGSSAFYLLAVCCLLPACCLLLAARCSPVLLAFCRIMPRLACCLPSAACRPLPAACRLLPAVCCLPPAALCLLPAACCLLHGGFMLLASS
jgi:hypothetical protein